ncbi:hypothetical protein MSIM_28500 [Mycobacterium simiae]|nr:hypothetical protein MSIM_28500 [Mycobacterium simiae]
MKARPNRTGLSGVVGCTPLLTEFGLTPRILQPRNDVIQDVRFLVVRLPGSAGVESAHAVL